ncbi:MAG: hypothetical protein A2516_03520 [Alphaproteobacteria bacterium RIFOXYD12_FULL_60_8]|nr:MAG: hypothetical protein A2516_03520 [Alphaproteobacteria bacterium RIFOXYD12_FULL_60_8]
MNTIDTASTSPETPAETPRRAISLTHGSPHRVSVMVALMSINMISFIGVGAVVIMYVLLTILNIDNPPTESMLFLNLTWLMVVSTPLLFVVGLAGTWISFGFRMYRRAFAFAPLPLINIIGSPVCLALSGVA